MPEKDHFSKLKLFFNSKFLTKFGPHSTQNQEKLEISGKIISLLQVKAALVT